MARNCPTAGGEGVEGAAPVAVPRGQFAPRGGLGARIGGFAPRGGFVGGFAGRGAFVGAGSRVVRCYKCGELNHMARSCTAAGPGPAVVNGAVRPKTCYKVSLPSFRFSTNTCQLY
ncbi:hypothetical protein T439DRAFT_36156 [Meredithblackwellia eburnea MCA 4105]